MEYIIDTNIAYYLAELSPCDKNFNISKFKLDNNFKFISSISLLELYIKYKNRLDIFKKIVKSLADNNIGIMVYGHNINNNLSLTCKKLYTKPKSYLKNFLLFTKYIHSDFNFKNRIFRHFNRLFILWFMFIER